MGETFKWSYSRKLVTLTIVVMMALGTMAVLMPGQTAQAALTPTQKQALAEKYGPIYVFNANEQTYPVKVDYAIQTSALYLAGSGNGTLIKNAGTYTLDQLGTTYAGNDQYYLNSIYGTMHDSSKIISNYQKNESTLGYTVYAHVIEETGRTCIQYWTYYVFNDGKFNDHVGDWEMTQVILDASGKPTAVGFSQHTSAMTATWDVVEKNGDHFKTYVALGSHANYFRYFQGLTGMAKDTVQGNGKVLTTANYNVTLINEKGAAPLWTNFAGRWGNWGSAQDDFLGQRGPEGPGFRMASGVFYYNGFSLQGSVSTQNPNMFYADMYFYYQWYIYIALFIIPVVLFIFRVRKKKRKGELKKPYLHLIDIKGADMRSIGNILAILGIALGIISAFFPYYLAQANVQGLGFSTEQYQDIVVVSGSTGVQINSLDPEMGLTQLASFPVPFGILITLTILTFLVGLIAVNQAKAGRKYLWRGFKFILPMVITIVLIVALKGVVPSFAPGPGVDATQQVVNSMAASPFGGNTRIFMADFGSTIDFRWSLGIGAYLMIVAAVLMFLGGFLQFFHKEKPKMDQNPQFQPYQQPYQQQYQQPPQQQYQPGPGQGYRPPQNPPQYPGPGQRPPSP
ncbi:MAG: Vps62-related protein [Methanomassiliicoccales archaeon]